MINKRDAIFSHLQMVFRTDLERIVLFFMADRKTKTNRVFVFAHMLINDIIRRFSKRSLRILRIGKAADDQSAQMIQLAAPF